MSKAKHETKAHDKDEADKPDPHAKAKVTGPAPFTLRTDMVNDKPQHVVLEPWPKQVLFSSELITSPAVTAVFKRRGDDVLEVHVANGFAAYKLARPDANGVQVGTLMDGSQFEDAPEGPADKPAEDPDLVALRSGLSAPGHAVGDSIPLRNKDFLMESGFRPIGVDATGRAWALEEIRDAKKGEPAEKLVFVGRLVT